MDYRLLLFDLDDTLYPKDSGLWPAIKDRIAQYMRDCLHIPAAEVSDLRRKYFETYGTTLRGLQIHHQVDSEEFLEYVHDLPLDQYIQPAPALRDLLLGLSPACWVFTNASAQHARRVIDCLGLEGCFTGIFDITTLEYHCKPTAEAYQRALYIAGISDPRQVVFFDDSHINLYAAQQFGMTAVLVGAGNDAGTTGYRAVADLLSLPQVMPELWESSKEVKNGF